MTTMLVRGIVVERPGMLSTIQDGGRFGWQHLGVVPGGAMDSDSMQIANALVGNSLDEATLELTLRGPVLRFECDALVALCGATFAIQAHNGADNTILPANRPILLKAGTRISIGQASDGFRAYLSVAGGIAVAPILGSRCTYLPAGFGGHCGRALKPGDRLPLATDADMLAHKRFARLRSRHGEADRAGTRPLTVRWSIRPEALPQDDTTQVRCIDGRHRSLFDAESLQQFESTVYRISSDSNRMGYRMVGKKLVRSQERDLLSEPTALGTIQVPPDGSPIVLMADHQTTGGYAKIAEVASVDIPKLAQLRPGQQVRFQRCSLAHAVSLGIAARAALATTVRSIGWKFQNDNPSAP